AMLNALTTGAPPRPLPAMVPAVIGEVIFRALSHDPNARFGTAMEMRQAIERAMSLTGLAATTNDVAAFLAEHLGEQAATRRRLIDAAVARAAASSSASHESLARLPAAAVVEAATTATTPAQLPLPPPVPPPGSELSANGSFGLASIPARPPPRRWLAIAGS